ncbi:hypothetical protein LguiA_009392 [Lonicera macranthoides]
MQRAHHIKSLFPVSRIVDSSSNTPCPEEDFNKFGFTDQLREFVKDITKNTFQDFPL